jgi:hypothetical protein
MRAHRRGEGEREGEEGQGAAWEGEATGAWGGAWERGRRCPCSLFWWLYSLAVVREEERERKEERRRKERRKRKKEGKEKKKNMEKFLNLKISKKIKDNL